MTSPNLDDIYDATIKMAYHGEKERAEEIEERVFGAGKSVLSILIDMNVHTMFAKVIPEFASPEQRSASVEAMRDYYALINDEFVALGLEPHAPGPDASEYEVIEYAIALRHRYNPSSVEIEQEDE